MPGKASMHQIAFDREDYWNKVTLISPLIERDYSFKKSNKG